MKILLGSHHFAPSIGGIETASELLAREFVKLGHEVRGVTQTPGGGAFPFSGVSTAGRARADAAGIVVRCVSSEQHFAAHSLAVAICAAAVVCRASDLDWTESWQLPLQLAQTFCPAFRQLDRDQQSRGR